MHCCPHCVGVVYCVGIVALLCWHHYPPCAVFPPLSCWRCCPHNCAVIGSDVGLLHHLWSQNDVIMSWLRLTVTLDCCPHPSYTYTKCLSTLIWRPLAYISSLTQLYLPYSAQILGFCVTCGIKMMSLCHGWCWHHSQTASCIHLRHILHSGWAHWYAVNWHMIAALPSYTPRTWGSDFGVLGHLWSQNDVIMSWLRLTAPY